MALMRRDVALATPNAALTPPDAALVIGTGDGVDGGLGAGNGSGVHVMKVYDMQNDFTKPDFGVIRKARPDGASRVELWVGFIPEGMAVPKTPQMYLAQGHGWPLYLRSFATGTIEARFPMPDRPMLIVYWARWANNAGDHGRFCKTCVGRVEGWPRDAGRLPERSSAGHVRVEHGARHALPAVEAKRIESQRVQATFLLMGTPLSLPVGAADADEVPLLGCDVRSSALMDSMSELPR